MAAKVEVVAMVYRSPIFAAFISDQLFGINARIVGNDPEQAVFPWLDDVYNDPKPNDHYLSRVYRCWNFCVESSQAEYVCLVNSDMALSDGWLEALEGRSDGRTLPVSRLLEPEYVKPSGQILTTGQHGLAYNLGRDPATFRWDDWRRVAAAVSEPRTEPGGLFMPCLLHRETFLGVGGYPEGNVEGVSGDRILFDRMAAAGFEHVTCFDSVVYHMQEGEMRHGE